MLDSIMTSSTYLAAVAALAAENKASGASGIDGSSAASDALAIQKIKEAIAEALVQNRENTSNAAKRIDELAEEERETEMKRLEAFDTKLDAYAGYAAASTDDAPIVRVDVAEDGEKVSYMVDISSVRTDKMSRIEALALMRHMQSDPQWSDITYTDMLSAIAKLYGTGSSAAPATNSGAVEQIGKYLKSASTYSSAGKYSSQQTGSSYVEFFSQTSSDRIASRALRLQDLLSKVITNDDGRKTLADGVYL